MADRITDNRSVGELLSDLSQETATLIRQQVMLARSELTLSLARLGRHAAVIVSGGVIAHAGMFAVAAALVLALVELGLAPWAAALIGGIALLAIGYLLVQRGLTALRRDQLTPAQTMETMKENAAWAKNQLQ
jgi:Putative Actinobacterial Holin-X, holin superfamily III